MLKNLAIVLRHIDFKNKRVWLLYFTMVSAAILEAVGISTIVPMIENMSGAVSTTSSISAEFDRFFNKLGLAPTVPVLLFAAFLIYAMKNILLILQRLLSKNISLKADLEEKEKLFSKLLLYKLEELKKHDFGHVTNIIASTTRIYGLLIEFGMNYLSVLFQVLVYLSIIVLISWQVLLSAALLGTMIYFASKNIFINAKRLGIELEGSKGDINSNIFNTLTGFKTIKAFVGEQYLKSRFKASLKKYKAADTKLALYEAVLASYYEPAMFLLVFVLVVVFHLSVSHLVVLLIALNRIVGRLNQLQSLGYKISHHLGSFSMTRELLDKLEESSYEGEEIGKAISQIDKGIEFKGVRFQYETTGGSFELNLPHMKWNKGDMIGIIGDSGAGKSTLIDLVLGFIKPQEGTILVDGIDLNGYNMHAYRRLLSYVPQDTYLINDTVLNNIKFPDFSISDEEAIRASRMAKAFDFVQDLPEQFATIVGENGSKLSGGQKQRLSIARALVRKPDFLILDEATSALDARLDKHVQEVLDDLKGTVTILVISHRFSTIQNADYIYALREGRIVQEGTMERLKKASGYFKETNELHASNPSV